jgi:peptidyl-dipeptidase A
MAATGARLADDVTARLVPLAVDLNRAWWDVNVEATDAHESRRVEAELALSDLLADRGLFGALEGARANGAGDTVRRQLDLLRDAFLPKQIAEDVRTRIVELEASVEARFASHRGVVGGREVSDNEIKQILRHDDDVALRREAWEASKTVGAEVAEDVRELARLRNAAAHSLGFRDWFALSIATSEMSEEKLFGTLDDVDRATAEPFARWKAALDDRLAARFGCAVSDLRAWHYADPFFQEVPDDGGVALDEVFAGRDIMELSTRTFDGVGLETRGILDRSDLFPREGKCQHAFCIDVDREGDIRVLANVVANHDWMDTMLHELGHGVFDAGIDAELPWLLRSCHLVSTEAIAILFGHLAGDVTWLEQVAGLPASDAHALAEPLRLRRGAQKVLFARWVLVMTNFERRLYADPEGDLDGAWWELVHRFQGVHPVEGRKAADWAAKIHIACAPVYYHTYLYGDLLSSQLSAALRRETGGLVDAPDAGRFLTERWFRPGLSLRWDELIEHATGEPLTARPFGEDIAGV